MAFLPIHISTWYIHSNLPSHQPAYIQTYLHTFLHTFKHTYKPTYLPTYIQTYLQTYLRTPSYTHFYLDEISFLWFYDKIFPSKLILKSEPQRCFEHSFADFRFKVGYIRTSADVTSLI